MVVLHVNLITSNYISITLHKFYSTIHFAYFPQQLEIVENFFERTLSLSLSEIPSEIKPDLRTPTSIQQQIARNEKLLETILNTSSVTKAECISRGKIIVQSLIRAN